MGVVGERPDFLRKAFVFETQTLKFAVRVRTSSFLRQVAVERGLCSQGSESSCPHVPHAW